MNKTNYDIMFGTPEAAARFITEEMCDCDCDFCIYRVGRNCTSGFDFDDYNANYEEGHKVCYNGTLKWLKKTAE